MFFRYYSITRSQPGHQPLKGHVIQTLIFTWMYGLIVALPPLLGWSKYELDTNSLACGASWRHKDSEHILYPIWYLWSSLLLPLIIKAICYYQLYAKVNTVARKIRCSKRLSNHTDRLARRVSIASMTHSSQTSATFSWGSNPPTGFIMYNNIRSKSSDLRQEKKLAKLMVLMVGVSTVTWLPYGLSSIVLTMRTDISSEILVMTSLLAKASVIYDPIIYVILNKKLRSSFVRVIPFMSYSVTSTRTVGVGSKRPSQRPSQRLSSLKQSFRQSQTQRTLFNAPCRWPSPSRVINHTAGLSTIAEASHCASLTIVEPTKSISPYESSSSDSPAFVSEEEGFGPMGGKKFSLPVMVGSTQKKAAFRSSALHGPRRTTQLASRPFHPRSFDRQPPQRRIEMMPVRRKTLRRQNRKNTHLEITVKNLMAEVD